MALSALDGTVHVRAPGKLNLFFEVGEPRADGYHDVASVYQAVSLYEDVWATPADEFTVAVRGTMDVSGVPLDDGNLALRAARALAQHIGYDGGVHLEIVKHVPVAGGMGGGSADAAAALVACDAVWGADLGGSTLQQLAAELGADVPFALMGGTAVGTGRGDRLSPALARARFDWVLVTDDAGLSTSAGYQRLDELRERPAPGVAQAPATPSVDPTVLQALRSGDPVQLADGLRNDLQAAALSLHPRLREVLELGESEGTALAGIVSGSGPTVAFLTSGPEDALDLQVALNASGRSALHVHGPVRGAHLIG